jgi:hypothetical protein|tara:strand:+ start:180 stop:491 length:312 start_codon:yes stop_codon:yes gene_type:complete
MGVAIIPVGPMNSHNQTAAQNYGHPNVAANSENISPPIEKARVRVVQAATKSEISANLFKSWEERVARMQEYERQKSMMVSYNQDGSANMKQNIDAQLVDIKA